MNGETIPDTAHAVYARPIPAADWVWLATFATEGMADSYAQQLVEFSGAVTEVRPA